MFSLFFFAAVHVFHVPNGWSPVISPYCFFCISFVAGLRGPLSSITAYLLGPSANRGLELWCVFMSAKTGRGRLGIIKIFLSLVGSHLIQRAH